MEEERGKARVYPENNCFYSQPVVYLGKKQKNRALMQVSRKAPGGKEWEG